MDSQTKSYLELHLSVILWGFTAVLGKVLKLSAANVVWWRCLLTIISLIVIIKPFSKVFKTSKSDTLKFFGIGMVFGLHWLAFFGSVKLSNSSIALICMSTCAFFTSLIEPVVLKSKFDSYNTFIAILIIPAMYLIFNSVDISMHAGIWAGLIGAFLASLTVTLNKKNITNLEPLIITLLEIAGAWTIVTLVKLFDTSESFLQIPDAEDTAVLIFLALACTTLTWVLVLRALKNVSAFSLSLAVNLEAVYGIVLSCLLLNEHQTLDNNFYIGSTMIILLVFTYPLASKLRNSQ